MTGIVKTVVQAGVDPKDASTGLPNPWGRICADWPHYTTLGSFRLVLGGTLAGTL